MLLVWSLEDHTFTRRHGRNAVAQMHWSRIHLFAQTCSVVVIFRRITLMRHEKGSRNTGNGSVGQQQQQQHKHIFKIERQMCVCVCVLRRGMKNANRVCTLCGWLLVFFFSWKCAIKSKLQLVLLTFCRFCVFFCLSLFSLHYIWYNNGAVVVLVSFSPRFVFQFNLVCSLFVRKSLTYGHVECMWCEHLR